MAKRKLIALALMLLPALGFAQETEMWMGANVKISGDAQWGSDAAQESLERLAASGAEKALLVAFMWQAKPDSNDPVIGGDSSPELVAAGLRQMRDAGLDPILKVHLWIPESWAGEAAPTDRMAWFHAYRDGLLKLAKVAEDEGAEALVVGSELRQLQNSGYWQPVVTAVREVYSGPIVYVTHSLESAEQFRYWTLFDVVATSLYAELPTDEEARGDEMREMADRLYTLGQRAQRRVWVAELGLRSATGSLSAPWESPEERELPVNLGLQNEVLTSWRDALDETGKVDGLAIWAWYTDPNAGGVNDTDFTIQNKPAQEIFKR
ncbi:glycoside hydrolase family 113 [Pseudomonas profundi]|uniref:glycoside hydrolase family 113 n=1 Tax=Pseudomonas profundi TaxID=1981513 RepID=UPI00123A4477|nr:glycosidase-like protein [Pseudomonas profundi]